MTEVQEYKKGPALTAEQAEAMFKAKVETAVKKALATPAPELAGPVGPTGQAWWNLLATSPQQLGAITVPPGPIGAGPALPHKIIQVNAPAVVQAVVWLNPWWSLGGALTPCNLLSNLALTCNIDFRISDLINMVAVPPPTPTPIPIIFTPGQCWYGVQYPFTLNTPGLYMMNITARILNAQNQPLAPFAAFATEVWDFDPELFAPVPVPGPHWVIDHPIRFMVY